MKAQATKKRADARREVTELQNLISDMCAVVGDDVGVAKTLTQLALHECERGVGRVSGELVMRALRAIYFHVNLADDYVKGAGEQYARRYSERSRNEMDAGRVLNDALNRRQPVPA